VDYHVYFSLFSTVIDFYLTHLDRGQGTKDASIMNIYFFLIKEILFLLLFLCLSFLNRDERLNGFSAEELSMCRESLE